MEELILRLSLMEEEMEEGKGQEGICNSIHSCLPFISCGKNKGLIQTIPILDMVKRTGGWRREASS